MPAGDGVKFRDIPGAGTPPHRHSRRGLTPHHPGTSHRRQRATTRFRGLRLIIILIFIHCFKMAVNVLYFRTIPHNSKCRYGERGAADAKPKAQIILDAAKVSAASGGYSEPKQGQRSRSARGFCPRSTMRVPQPYIIEHFGLASAAPRSPYRHLELCGIALN